MEIVQANWRGKCLTHRKDRDGMHVAMSGSNALLYFPVVAEPNSTYRVSLELRKEGGNGIAYCNIYGNKSFDFPHVPIFCENTDWGMRDFDLKVGTYPKTLSLMFRIWRNPGGTGTLAVKRIIVAKMEASNDQVWIPCDEKPAIQDVPAPDASNDQPELSAGTTEQDRADPEFKFSRFDGPPDGTKVMFLHYTDDNISQFSLTEAFAENGFRVCSFCFNECFHAVGSSATQKMILDTAKTFGPDWIHMQLQFFDKMVSLDTVRELRSAHPDACITNWTADIRAVAVPYFVEVGKLIHRPLITSEGQLELYRTAGCGNVDYWQIGFDPKRFFRKSDDERALLQEKYKHDFSFCANRNVKANFPGAAFREEVARGMSQAFGKRFGLYGYKWDLPGVKQSLRGTARFYDQNDIYNGSKVVISSNHFNDVRKYFSDRQLVCLATGTLTVSTYIPGLEEYFVNGKDLVWFKTAAECVELCRHYAGHPQEADAIGKAGAEKVMKEHTYSKRVAELAKRLGFK